MDGGKDMQVLQLEEKHQKTRVTLTGLVHTRSVAEKWDRIAMQASP